MRANTKSTIMAIKHLKLLCLIILSALAFPSAKAMDLMARSVINNQDFMDDYRASTFATGRGIDCFRGSDVIEHLGLSAARDSIIFEIDTICYDDAGNVIGRFPTGYAIRVDDSFVHAFDRLIDVVTSTAGDYMNEEEPQVSYFVYSDKGVVDCEYEVGATNCGRFVSIFDTIGKCARNSDSAGANSLAEEMVSLTDSFLMAPPFPDFESSLVADYYRDFTSYGVKTSAFPTVEAVEKGHIAMFEADFIHPEHILPTDAESVKRLKALQEKIMPEIKKKYGDYVESMAIWMQSEGLYVRLALLVDEAEASANLDCEQVFKSKKLGIYEAPIVGYRVSPAFFNDPEAVKCLIRKIYSEKHQ